MSPTPREIEEDRHQAEDFIDVLHGAYPGSFGKIDEDLNSAFWFKMPDGQVYHITVKGINRRR